MHAYTKLHNNFIDLKSKHVNLKSDHELLASKFDTIAKDNVILKENNEKLKLDHITLSSNVASLIHEKNDAMLEVESIRSKFTSFKNDHICSTSIDNACLMMS